MKAKDTKEQILKKVFEFYAQYQEECDKAYNEAEDSEIGGIYSDINRDEVTSLMVRTAIVLLTANKYEKNILHQNIFSLNNQKISRMDIRILTAYNRYNTDYCYWFNFGEYLVLHIHANITGSYTIGGSGDIVRWILSNPYLLPTVIISFGVCFGTKENENSLTDVVISEKVYPYFVGVKLKGKEITVVDDNMFRITSDLYNKIHYLMDSNVFPHLKFHTILGNYITGEAVVSSKMARDKFMRTTSQDIRAGEMEGYGLFKECNSGIFKVPCLIVKSICDWGAEKNFNVHDHQTKESFLEALGIDGDPDSIEKILETLKDRLQAIAALRAFDVMKAMIENQIFNKAVFDLLYDWLRGYNGFATTCNQIEQEAERIIESLNLGSKPIKQYTHISIEIMKKMGLIECNCECTEKCMQCDKCKKEIKNASVTLLLS